MGLFSRTVIARDAVLLGRPGANPTRNARVRRRLATNPRKARQYWADRTRRGNRIADRMTRDARRRDN